MDKQAESYVSDFSKAKACDLTGDGTIDVIVQEWTGGAYCCYTYDIYSLGRTFKRIWHHNVSAGHLNVTTKANQPVTLEMEDGAFAFWQDFSIADYVLPVVYLVWKNGKFVVDRHQMRKPVDQKKLERLSTEPNSKDARKYFVELFYMGQAPSALKLIEKLPAAEYSAFLKSFYECLKTSEFRTSLVTMNDKHAVSIIEHAAKH